MTSANFQFKKNKKEGVHYEKNINRFEFTEILVRIAELRYIKHGHCEKYGEAVKQLLFDIDPFIQNEMQRFWGGLDWRHNHLINEDLNQLLTLNMKNLEALHKKYTSRTDRVATYAKPGEFILEDGIKIFDDSRAEVKNYFINMVFPLSKQCYVVNDSEESGIMAINKLNFSEYLEFFTRVAYLRYLKSEMEGLDLVDKVQYLMDEVFQECLGCERAQPPEDQFESESDNEY